MPTEQEVTDALKKVIEPETGTNIVELRTVKDVKIEGDKVKLTIALTSPTCPAASTIKKDVQNAIFSLGEVKSVDIDLVSMSERERMTILTKSFAMMSKGEYTGRKRLSLLSYDRQRGVVSSKKKWKDKLPKHDVKSIVAIVPSGKGGIEKSIITSLLAVELKRLGLEVGILDADITTPSIAPMFNVNKADVDVYGLHPAVTKSGIKIMSINLFRENIETPLMWRGSVIDKAVTLLFEHVRWTNLDYLLIDLP
ncbi:MAG: P-loop NTPase, partial [Candidatus Bathyarchaeota archaeon]